MRVPKAQKKGNYIWHRAHTLHTRAGQGVTPSTRDPMRAALCRIKRAECVWIYAAAAEWFNLSPNTFPLWPLGGLLSSILWRGTRVSKEDTKWPRPTLAVTHFTILPAAKEVILYIACSKLIPKVRNSKSGAESAVVIAVPEGDFQLPVNKNQGSCAHRQNHERRPVLELFGARAASQNCNSFSQCFCHFSEVEGHAACAC